MLIISLYTSRVVLSTLGIEDYGVYNVVGGFVAMFGILTSSLSAAISRFITFGLGKGDLEHLRKVYSTSIIIQFAMAVIIGLLIEGIGIWYFNHKINIPVGRETAAFWVLQCSIVTFGLALISVPYNAEIVAHERMDVYALFSILDATIALAIVFALKIVPFDKLILYAILCMASSLLMRCLYAIYCRRKFEECRFKLAFEKDVLQEMGSFAGWNLVGQIAFVFNTMGVNLLVNSFFGVTFNAARGVADRVNGLVGKFTGNFMTAMEPQITKTYAENDLKSMHAIIFRGTRLAAYLMIVLAIPICLETTYLLDLWLVEVPEHAVTFARLTVAGSIISVLGRPLIIAQHATGKIKRYEIRNALCEFWVFPLTWLAFRMGFSAEWSYYISLLVYFLLLFIRIFLVRNNIQLPWKSYIREVYCRIGLVLILSFIPPAFLHFSMQESFWRFLFVTLVSTLSLGGFIYWFGIDNGERTAAIQYIKDKWKIIRTFLS